MLRIIIVFFAMTSVLSGWTQKSLQNGWVILNNGDTLYGTIQEKDWNIGPEKLSFVREGNVISYHVSDLKSFGINDGDIYRRFTVEIHSIPDNERMVYPEDENKTETFTLWLKIIVQADISLAALYMKERIYFYAIDKNGVITELVYGKGIRSFTDEKFKNDIRYGKTVIFENSTYRTQLEGIFSTADNSGLIKSTLYTETSLEKLFRKLNNNTLGSFTKTKLLIGVNAGISLFSSSTSGEFLALLYNAKIKEAIGPFARISFNIKSSRKRARLIIVPEIGFSTFNTTGTKSTAITNSKIDIKNVFLEAQVLNKFILNPASNTKFYLAGGLNALVRVSGKNSFRNYDNNGTLNNTTDDPKQHSFIVAPSLSAGFMLSKIEGFINYQSFGQISDYSSSKWTVTRYSAGIGYIFKK